MTTSKRLRQLADRTGLDGFADELRAMADEMDAAAQPAPDLQAELDATNRQVEILSDGQIESLFIACGGCWTGDYWRIHDADLHQLMRTFIATPPAQPAPVRKCRSCDGSGEVSTGVWESPAAICKPCSGTGQIATHPAAQPAVPLTRERVKEICAECGYDTANVRERADFIHGIRQAEAAHGITRTIIKGQA